MTAKKKAAAKPETNPLVEQVEAAARVKPEGMPPLWPLHAMPRRERATALRRMGELTQGFQRLSDDAAPDEDGNVQLDLSKVGVLADFTDLCADIADFLVVCAAPNEKDAMRTWADECPDQELAGAFSYFMATMQPGEAASS